MLGITSTYWTEPLIRVDRLLAITTESAPANAPILSVLQALQGTTACRFWLQTIHRSTEPAGLLSPELSPSSSRNTGQSPFAMSSASFVASYRSRTKLVNICSAVRARSEIWAAFSVLAAGCSW